jgi:sec-independent protein translocase protein TatB
MAFAFIFESVAGTEWLVLLGVILIVVGPKNLPSAARKLGNIMSTLRRAADEFKRQLLTMDEEFRKAVDDSANEVSDSTDPSGDDPPAVPDSDDVPEEDGSAYDYDSESPYPGHDYYDETQYQDGSEEASVDAGDEPASEPQVEKPSGGAESSLEQSTPKKDPYAIKITVTTAADRKKGRK